MGDLNDIRLDLTNSAKYNIRRATFVIKSLGKEYYPEAILGKSIIDTTNNAVQKMEMMHRERSSHNAVIKPSRTWWQDELIKSVVEMTISPYIDVRRLDLSVMPLICRGSQTSLFVIIRRYKRWAPLVLPFLLEALKSNEIDIVKGAVHTLRLSTIEHTLARNWEYTDKYVLGLTEAWSVFDRVLSFR